MQVLAVSTNTGDPRPYLDAEAAQMGHLQHDGVVSNLWVKADWSGAVLVLDCADLPAARAAVDTLPLVQHGLTTFALTEIVAPPPGV